MHEGGCFWVWTLQHHKKKLAKAVQETTYVFLLTYFEEWFLSCMDKHRKIHLQCSQTEIRSKRICEIESPFFKPLQKKKPHMANLKHNIENHLQKIAKTANLKHQHSSCPSCSRPAYVKTSRWIIFILPGLWKGVILNTYFILTTNIII